MKAHLTICSNDPDLHTAIWWIEDPAQPILSALEDALYVLWEMTPTSRDWKRDLSRVGVCGFDYHGEDPGIVQWIGDMTFRIDF